MNLISKEYRYKHGQYTVHVHQRANNTATVWITDGMGNSVLREVGIEYVKLLAPGATVEQRGTTFEVTPASALFER